MHPRIWPLRSISIRDFRASVEKEFLRSSDFNAVHLKSSFCCDEDAVDGSVFVTLTGDTWARRFRVDKLAPWSSSISWEEKCRVVCQILGHFAAHQGGKVRPQRLFQATMKGVEMAGVFAVIMAGGRGERLWPLSTPVRPKQFFPFFRGKVSFRLQQSA